MYLHREKQLADAQSLPGINTFMGKYHKCMNTETGEKYSHEIIPNRTICIQEREKGAPADWVNARVTFDNVFIAYVALLQVRARN